ncbi:sialic acid synthase SpsE [Paenibacillus forsythiae]|uniref:Sialic acid synthase SpsE n=1 Tax=Paenibacillus forsythiae TaxID=365616 RepID=A0ABU3HAZ9_9BACL|nr:N-acetylneuraminate synthase family protein [Paenibacillus forsythiae]MDT3428002.1 sialic acid synthase SpsE [Paenibacillus forsythiae]
MTLEDRPYIIAEIGCNHKGEIAIAKEMIQIAATYCKVDAVKFQKRNPKELLTGDEYGAPHHNSFKNYEELKTLIESFEINYSTSMDKLFIFLNEYILISSQNSSRACSNFIESIAWVN